MRRVLLAVALLLGGLPAVRAADHARQAGPLDFRRLLVNTGGERTEACFRFDRKLDAAGTQPYADHLRIVPALPPALRVDDADLCVGNLEFGARYQVTLLAGLAAADGTRLAHDVTLGVGLGDRPASVAVAGDGFILPRATAHGLAVQTVNVARVRVHVFRVTAAGAVSGTLAGRGGTGIDLTATTLSPWTFAALLQNRLAPVWHGDMDIAAHPNRTVETAFPLAGVIGTDRPGLFLLVVEDAAKAVPARSFDPSATGETGEESWPGGGLAAHWVDVTDTALTSFSGADGLHVFARSLATARPLGGVHLVLQARSGDVLADATTGPDGALAFPPGVTRGSGAQSPAVLATAGTDDFAMLRLDRAGFDFSDRGATGLAEPGRAQAFLATERGIYRPGETVHVTALLRDATGRALPDERLTLVLRRPDGVETGRTTLAASPDGGWAAAERLTNSAAFGTWRLEALDDQTAPPVGSISFSVQDFVPQLLAVGLHPAAATLRAGQPLAATVDGRFLYGAPAAGLAGQGELRIEPDPDPVPDLPGYSWGLADEKVAIDPVKLDIPAAGPDGRATLDLAPKLPEGLTRPLRAVLTAGLFEPGGRIVEDTATLSVIGNRPLIGLRPAAVTGDTDRQPARVAIATVSAERRPVALAGLRWSVIRENRIYDWFESSGSWTFHYHVIDEPVLNGTLDTGANGLGRIAPSLDWGNYRVVVADPASGATSSVHVDVGWDRADSGPDAPDRVPVTVRDKDVAAGATTVVHIAAPFAGHALLAIAGSRVFETRELDVPRTGLDVTVTARPEWGAGAYALVTLYRPLDQPARPHDPVRAVGLAWIGLDQSARRLAVTLHPPAQVLPRRPLLVPVSVTGGKAGEVVRLTLAGVDEGILQLTRYRTPDPAAALFGKRALGLDMRDDYGRLLDGGAQAGIIHAGGDQGEGGAGLPVVSSRIVSLFTGPVTLDAGGNATVPLDVPDFEGQLRLMALAWSPGAVGSASADVTIRDPVFADVALPRFLAPGDSARIAVSVANTDAPAGRFHVVLAASGAVRLQEPASFDPDLAPGARAQFAANLVGVGEGIGTVTASLSRPGEAVSLRREWQIAVRAPHAPQTTTTTAEQRPGEVFSPDPGLLAGFVPGTGSLTVGYAGYAGIDTVGLLQSLDADGWSCSEQLASGAWPLLYFDDPALLGRLRRPEGIHARVQRSVDGIVDREDAAGRFGLWRVGDGAATPWLDAYLVDFLLHARDAGFTVPASSLDRALDWLDEEQVQGFGDFDRFRKTAPETRAYALFVLARAGRASPDAIRRMHDDLYVQGSDPTRLVFWSGGADAASLAEPSALAHLGAALRLTGDDAAGGDAYDMAVDNLGSVRTGRAGWLDFTYWSYVRDLASVTALAAEGGDDRRAQALVGRIGLLGLTPPLLNTQEKAALLGAAHALNRDRPGRQLSLNGTPTAPRLHLPAAFSPAWPAPALAVPAPSPGQSLKGPSLSGPSSPALSAPVPPASGPVPPASSSGPEAPEPYALANTGTVPLWRSVTVTGVPAGPVASASHGFTLERRFLDLEGVAINPAHLRQNDRVLVVLQGRAGDDDNHRAVLVDRLPAALEIEGPVRAPDAYPFLGALTRPRSVEARDDRLVVAFDLGADLDPPKFTEENDDAGSSDDSDKPQAPGPEALGPKAFRVAYIARVVTPGRFTVPEAVVQDMYRPALTARTASGSTEAAAASP